MPLNINYLQAKRKAIMVMVMMRMTMVMVPFIIIGATGLRPWSQNRRNLNFKPHRNHTGPHLAFATTSEITTRVVNTTRVDVCPDYD